MDTLTFNQNEVTKDFLIPSSTTFTSKVGDFPIALLEPAGATLGAHTTAAVTIVDDDTVQPTSNRSAERRDGLRLLVRQQYLDFL